MNIQPFRDIVLIKADKVKEQTESGILLAEVWKTRPLEGEVMAIGSEVKEVKIGDRVGFMLYGAVILEDDMRLCKEGHIIYGCSKTS